MRKILIHQSGPFFKGKTHTLEKPLRGKGIHQLHRIRRILKLVTSQLPKGVITYKIEII